MVNINPRKRKEYLHFSDHVPYFTTKNKIHLYINLFFDVICLLNCIGNPKMDWFMFLYINIFIYLIPVCKLIFYSFEMSGKDAKYDKEIIESIKRCSNEEYLKILIKSEYKIIPLTEKELADHSSELSQFTEYAKIENDLKRLSQISNLNK